MKQPDKFTGKGRPRFEEFINRFETYAGNKNAPEEEKFQSLLDCLGGEARDLISGYTEVPYVQGMYSQVLRLLTEHYGDTRVSIVTGKQEAIVTGKQGCFPLDAGR